MSQTFRVPSLTAHISFDSKLIGEHITDERWKVLICWKWDIFPILFTEDGTNHMGHPGRQNTSGWRWFALCISSQTLHHDVYCKRSLIMIKLLIKRWWNNEGDDYSDDRTSRSFKLTLNKILYTSFSQLTVRS